MVETEFLVSLSYPSKREFKWLEHRGSPFFVYVLRACTFLIACYDAFMYGTAYLISPTKSNDPAGGLFRTSPTLQRSP